MNILLVDDEYYNIESLEKKIEAYFDVFEHIFCAYSKEQALRYFEDNVIDIMICDIEMPGGSGLELLEQIRIRNNNQTICIFLTAFARFEYASKALKLSSFDYLLKPVKDETLRLSVQRAIDERRKKSLEEENAEMAAFWKEGELYLTEQLWSDVIHGNIAGSKAGIERELHLRKLDGKIVDKQYFFLMIYSMPNGELYNHMSKELYNFTLKNILRDFFYTEEVMPVVIEAADRIYLLPIDRKLFSRAELLERCNNAVLEFVPFYKNYFIFLLSDRPYCMEEAAEITEYMKKEIALNVVPQNKVLELRTVESSLLPGGQRHEMPLKRWENLVWQKKTGEMKLEVKSYLKVLEADPSTNAKTLSEFYYGFMQLLHVTISSVGETASERFNKYLSQHSGTPYTSFELLWEWCVSVLNAYEECVKDNSDNDAIVATVKRYIKEHLAEDMNREALAALVYLHPDYLSHVFKNKTGTSVTNYIISERINEAKRLLLKGNQSIRDIAISCGFQSVPYFSKQFKKATGVSPRDFKR